MLLDKDSAAAGHLNIITEYIPAEGTEMAKAAAKKPKVEIKKTYAKKPESLNVKILDAEFKKDFDADAMFGKSK